MNNFPNFFAQYGTGEKHASFDITDFKDWYWMHMPSGMMEFIEEHEISSLMNGFLWTLNPMDHMDWFKELLEETSDLELPRIPFARTAFGDIFYIESESINLLSASRMTLESFAFDADSFLEWTLSDTDFVNEKLNYALFSGIQGKTNVHNCFPIVTDNGALTLQSEISFEAFKAMLSDQKGNIKWEEV